MKTIYLESFQKDLRKVKEKKVKTNLSTLIEQIKNDDSITEIKNLKKIKGAKKFYRVKMGDYRFRFLHRKDIYRFFP